MKKKLFYCVIIFSLAFIVLSSSFSFAQSWLWGNEAIPNSINAWGDPSNGDHSITTDKSGNIFFTGYFKDTLTFGTFTLKTYDVSDFFLIKYNANGNVQWAKQSNIPNRNCEGQGTAVAIDKLDNVYITGYFSDTISFASYMLTSPQAAVFLVKYDSSGNVLWAKQSIVVYIRNNFVQGTSIILDPQGNAYITGTFRDTMSFGSFTLKTIGENDFFLVKYDSSGNVLWAKQSNSTILRSNAYGNSLAIDASENIYLTGDFVDSITIGTYGLITDSPYDMFLAKYDSGGNVLWAKQASYNSWGVGNSVAIDGAGNVYVIGDFFDSISFGTFHLINNNANIETIFLTKFNASGNVLWAEQGNSIGNYHWHGYSVVCDSLISGGGYLVMSSSVTGKGLIFDADTFKINDNNFHDGSTIILKFDSSGNVLCGNIITEGAEDDYDGIAVDHAGKYIYIGGDLDNEYSDIINFGNNTLIAYPTLEIPFVARWAGCVEANFNAIATGISPVCANNCSGIASSSPQNGIPPYTYLWTNGQTTQNISGLCKGTYSVTIIDANHVTATATISITEPNQLAVISSQISNVICYGDSNGSASFTASGGTAPYTYNWSDSQTGANAIGLTAGGYSLTVTDANGCATSASVILSQPMALLLSDTILTNEFCFGGTAGIVSAISSGGVTPYTYSWSNGNTTTLAGGLTAGNYSTTVTDINGCIATASATLTQAPVLEILHVMVVSNVSCYGSSNGNVSVSVSGGTFPYNYSWTNGNTESNITAFTAGGYTVTVTDVNHCEATASVTITQPVQFLVFCSQLSGINCNGNSTGSAGASASGGIMPYSYSWSNGQTGTEAIGLSAGIYIVNVSDANGCAASTSISISQPIQLSVANLQLSNISCFSESNGSASLTVSGGTSPYTYIWSNGQKGTDDTGLSAGSYTLNIIDSNGCGLTTSVTLTQPSAIKVSITAPASVCKDSTATLIASGGTTYLWNNGATTSSINTSNIVISPTTYTVTAYNGVCSKDTTFTLTLKPQPVVGITKDTSICQGQSITLKASGGGAYLWSTSATTDSIVVSPSTPTSYTVIVDSVCIATASVTVSVSAPAALNISNDTTIFSGDTALIYANGNKGTNKYLWSPNYNLSCDSCPFTFAFPTQTTTYTVTGSNAEGCSINELVTVYVIPHCYDFIVPNVFTPNGDGINDLLVIKELQQYEPVSYSDLAYTISIYDRWGKEMFKSYNPASYWDGNTQNGAKAPDGVYFYIITSSCHANGQSFTYDKKGFVQVIR